MAPVGVKISQLKRKHDWGNLKLLWFGVFADTSKGGTRIVVLHPSSRSLYSLLAKVPLLQGSNLVGMFFAVMLELLVYLTAVTTYVRADPNPTSPGPGDIFIQGQPCLISWDVDPTGVWTNMNIDLMTGDNFDMVFLTSVATGVDGTNPSKNTFSYTCPQVSPHSAIYFYQFSSSSAPNKTWTGRFTITDSPSSIVAPSQSTQPNGAKIAWGIGTLPNGSSALSASVSMGNSSAPMSSTQSTSPVASLLHTPTPSFVRVTSGAHATSTAVFKAGANGAVPMFSVVNSVLQGGLGLGLAALGFTLVL